MRARHHVNAPRGPERDPWGIEDPDDPRLVQNEQRLQSGHAAILAARKRRLVALTIEYGALPPVAAGRRIDWEQHVLRPAEQLMATAERHAIALTFMPEIGQYRRLLQHDAALARRVEGQWRDAVARGHDVQLRLHPNWLPGLGNPAGGDKLHRDPFANTTAEAPEFAALIGDVKARLEALLRPIDPAYTVLCCRAGGYGAQRLGWLYDALASNGIGCDSSVLAGGVSQEHGYDYRLAYSNHQPYFASATDPQLRAPPAERAVVELPIFSDGAGSSCCLDGDTAGRFAAMLLRHVDRRRRRPITAERGRAAELVRSSLFTLYLALAPVRPIVNRLLVPKSIAHWLTPLYPPETLTGHEYYVMTGHTRGDLEFGAIADGLRQLRADGRFEFVRLSGMAHAARKELKSASRANPREEAEHQVASARSAVLSDEHNERQSAFLQQRIPLDRTHVLDLGCGAGYWADRIARRYPWMRVTGVDWGRDFIEVAAQRYGSPRVEFRVADFAALPFGDCTFDCVYADNVLEHAYDIEAVLREVRRVLEDGGVIVAAIPSDACNPCRSNENHTWKTAPHDVRMRFERAGFCEVDIVEKDAFRRFATMPYPPSKDRMMFVRAWRRGQRLDRLGRTTEAMHRVHRLLEPPSALDVPGEEPVA